MNNDAVVLWQSLSGEKTDTCEGGSGDTRSIPSSCMQNDADLAMIVEAWPKLADPIQAAIIALINTANQSQEQSETTPESKR